VPVDPRGSAYRYGPSDDGWPLARLGTLGRDGKPGGEGEDADLDTTMDVYLR
jgi:hypothetical protein